MDELFLKPLPRDVEKTLISRGASGGDFFRSKEKVEVFSRFAKFETTIPGVHAKTIARMKQQKFIERVVAKPLSGNYVLGIASYPSDALAKYLALHIAARAHEAWREKHSPGKATLVWHRVYGGLSDNLRDKQADNPSMLIISNVNEGSSNYKLEKVRDLLELYSTIPRIVVVGSNDPVTFFATKLWFPINAGVLLGPSNRIQEC